MLAFTSALLVREAGRLASLDSIQHTIAPVDAVYAYRIASMLHSIWLTVGSVRGRTWADVGGPSGMIYDLLRHFAQTFSISSLRYAIAKNAGNAVKICDL
ncbi:hypothetical protein A4U98_07735 [Bifidobacterium animalis subsp. animalis]|nr:hypothetical protein A4U98_07735 [Bifidobacterium animalis subsp. animalis]